ncbi:Uncharacterised protein [Serratia quinivorans]|uniref:DUF4325 domain-containing protein n=1 Tax=Serratia quinivorans TaxID=137545 RepID=UPI00217B3B7E|nr:DUF4325 domain-containing protein [Serratia quinivorans]CAI1056871.1 Uncharacterised protein [Serratia quinivorans]CAI1072162.1 Uncharacterised protein [Serratia quinivorans]CAI1874805.1 Uncharacterised protein [Serratia quinivorans]CAI2122855.1 Uncharacterised protein [Serratia quinivorans]CAI2489413.1 Uncharacterised protein [Serratia quinivorans]
MMSRIAGIYMKLLNIGKDFSSVPSGRFRTDGSSSGETFREDFLRKEIECLADGEKLKVIIDDEVEGYGSSFLVEGFAGMVKYGYIQSKDLLNKLVIDYSNPDFEFYKNKIVKYIMEAKFNSQQYEPTK